MCRCGAEEEMCANISQEYPIVIDDDLKDDSSI